MTKYKREITFTDDESQLVEGFGYDVLYRENETGCERMASALWINREFQYHYHRFIQGGAPQFGKIDCGNQIVGFFRMIDYRNKEG